MNRREFHATLLNLSAAALSSPRLFADAQTGVSPAIADLYKRAIVIDSLCGPFADSDISPSPELVSLVGQSGITAINFTISDRDFEGTVKNLGSLEILFEKYPQAFLFVRKHSDIARAKKENKLGIIPGFQYTAFLESDRTH